MGCPAWESTTIVSTNIDVKWVRMTTMLWVLIWRKLDKLPVERCKIKDGRWLRVYVDKNMLNIMLSTFGLMMGPNTWAQWWNVNRLPPIWAFSQFTEVRLWYIKRWCHLELVQSLDAFWPFVILCVLAPHLQIYVRWF